MPLYAQTFDTATVLVTQAASPGAGWTTMATVQAAFDKARNDGRPLFIRPGVYTTAPVVVTTGTGGGKPLYAYAVPGTVTIKLASAGNLLTIQGVASCKLEGLIFDAAGVALPNPESALLRVENADPLVSQCVFVNSTKTGIYATANANAKIDKCRIASCNFGIWSSDATSEISGNIVESCTNNGIMIYRSTVTGDSSRVTENLVKDIGSTSGTGQNGNGVSIYRAIGVVVSDNRFFNCQYSAVRANGGGNLTVADNNIYNAREMAIFIEATSAGINLNGATITGNTIDNAGIGISVANQGLYGDGVAKRATVSNNHITGIVKRVITDPGYVPQTGNGAAIVVEGGCVVSANVIETAAGFGIIAGTNDATRDLNINGNLVISAATGIGWSNHPSAGQVLIVGNMVKGATNGSIVPVLLNGATQQYARVAGSLEYGNQPSAQIGNAFIGNNRGY